MKKERFILQVPVGTVVRETTNTVNLRSHREIEWLHHPGALGNKVTDLQLREAQSIAERLHGENCIQYGRPLVKLDLDEVSREPTLLCEGGHGGYGNVMFITKTNRAPAFATKGEQGEEREFYLELKTISDVGLVGKPNAGKSTFLSQISRATPRIESWPFTTLSPHIGTVILPRVRNGDDFSYTIADIPGLIEGASEGKGLGHSFLRHVERANALAYVVDLSDENPAGTFRELYHELKEFNPSLLSKKAVVLANKADIEGTEHRMDSLVSSVHMLMPGITIVPMSAQSGLGFDRIKLVLASLVVEAREAQEAERRSKLDRLTIPIIEG